MKSNLRNEIKSYIVRQGMTMQRVVDLLHDEHGWSRLPARSALQSVSRFEVSTGDPRPLATLARLSLHTLQRKQSADADNFHRKV